MSNITSNGIRMINKKYDEIMLLFAFIGQIRRLEKIVNPIFIIGIKGSLHIIDLCLKFIPNRVNVILILAGMDEWEIDWAKKHLCVSGYIVLDKQLKHGAILDLLFKCRKSNFGIMDYDLFISNPIYFDLMRSINSNSIGNVLFMYEDPNLHVKIPQTFFMFFNALMVRSIMQRFDVSCSVAKYEELSQRVKSKLQSINFDGRNMPEGNFGKDYFDTFRLISLLGLADGYEFNWVNDSIESGLNESGVFHVSGISNPAEVKNRWRRRGSFFWQRSLALHPDLNLRTHYQQLFPNLPTVHDLEQLLRNDGYTGSWYFDSVNELLKSFGRGNISGKV
jgi:hypothetical protein